MSRKFNPLSTAVALATASLLIGIAGCASQRSADETAGLSRDADTQPTLAQATPSNPLDTTSQPNAVDSTTVAMPAETPSAAIPPAAISEQQPPMQTSQSMSSSQATDVSAPPPMPAQAYPSTPAYPSSADTTSSSTATTTTDTSSSNNYNSEQALPPRRDRH